MFDGVDSSFGKKSSSFLSPMSVASLFSITRKMLGCLFRGLIAPRIEASAPGVLCSRVGARLTDTGAAVAGDEHRTSRACSASCRGCVAVYMGDAPASVCAVTFVAIFVIGRVVFAFSCTSNCRLDERCAAGLSPCATAPLA